MELSVQLPSEDFWTRCGQDSRLTLGRTVDWRCNLRDSSIFSRLQYAGSQLKVGQSTDMGVSVDWLLRDRNKRGHLRNFESFSSSSSKPLNWATRERGKKLPKVPFTPKRWRKDLRDSTTQEKLKRKSRVLKCKLGKNQGKDFSLVLEVNWCYLWTHSVFLLVYKVN